MTDRDFDYAGTMYTFSHIRVSSGGGLQISMTGAFSQTALDNLTFHAGSSSFALSDGTGTDNQTLSWNSAGLIWSSGQTIAISFTLTEADTTPPALSTGHQVNPTGTVIYLEFDEALEDDAALKPPTSAFTVTVDGVANAVTAVAFGVGGSASRVGLSFAETIAQGQVVTVSYADPTTGNDVASFSNIAVTNNSTVDITAPSPESSEVAAGGTSVTVNFNENLDIAVEFLPAAVVAAFTLTADDVELDIDRISMGGSESLVIIPPSGTTIYFLPRVYLARRAKPALDVCETQNPTRDPIHSQVGPPNAFMRHAGSCLPARRIVARLSP